MLRDRLYSPVPSPRLVAGKVENVTTDSGTNRKPSPAPWMNPVTTMVDCATSRVHPIMSYIAKAVSPQPGQQ